MPRHLTRGIVLLAAMAIAVGALAVAWGDAPAVLSALGRFPPLLILPVVPLTVWNYTTVIPSDLEAGELARGVVTF